MQQTDLITEEQFSRRFYKEVLPYLAERRTEGYFAAEENVSLWYEHYDTEVRPVRGTVVMVHGYIETLPKYYENVWYFLQNGYHVRQLQLRGHGRSTRHVKDPYLLHITDYRFFLRDIDRYIHRLVLKQKTDDAPLYYYGHSMGGALGGLYLALRPGVFPKAVLSSPMMEIKRGKLRVKIEAPLVHAASHTPLKDHYAPGMRRYDGKWTFEHSHTATKARWDYIADYIDRDEAYQTWGASWQTVRELFTITQVVRNPDICNRIRAKVLVFSASDDGLVERGGQLQFVSNVRSARLVDVPGTKHEIFTGSDEALRMYWDEIFSFLQSEE